MKFPPRRGESENRRLVEEVVEEAEVVPEKKRRLHVKGVCLRVVSNSTFETWSQLYQSSELYGKTEPHQNSEIHQRSEFEQNPENRQCVERLGSSERLLEDATKCRNDLGSLSNGGNNQCDYYNFQIISQV